MGAEGEYLVDARENLGREIGVDERILDQVVQLRLRDLRVARQLGDAPRSRVGRQDEIVSVVG